MCLRSWIAAAATLLVAGAALAQNPDAPKTTAKEGELLPAVPFPSFNVNGAKAKRLVCLFVERDQNPTVAVIAFKAPEKPSEPLAGLLQKLETRATEQKATYFGAFAIFLTMEKPLSDDPTGGTQFGAVEGLISQLKLKEVTVGLETKDVPQAAAFGIDKDKDEVTVLVYTRLKVERRFTFTKDKPMTDKDVDDIVAAAEKIIPMKKKKYKRRLAAWRGTPSRKRRA